MKVSYNVSKPIVMQSGISQSKMTLVSSADKSLYYNTTSMYVDSLSSTPEGKAELKRLLGMESVSIDENGQVKMNINENIHKKRLFMSQKTLPTAPCLFSTNGITKTEPTVSPLTR